MKNLILTSSFILFGIFLIQAQEVVSSGGEYFENTNISISWTLGEPVTETISDENNILTQGFQQSKLSTSEIFSLNSDIFDIKLFPNPTKDFINLITEKYKNLSFCISDSNGKLLSEGKIISENTEIPVSNFPAAIYFLKISNNNQIIKIFQIVKQ